MIGGELPEPPMPRVAIVAGINGAGKTTASQPVLRGVLKMPTFVNADTIARGLNGFNPESEAAKAGRIMLEHLRELAARRADFSFETTLAGRAYAPWLAELRAGGYEVYLYYYWLRSPEISIGRVAERVAAGGHHIPSETIRQRYAKSVRNFFDLYRPLCTHWRVYDNTEKQSRLIAYGTPGGRTILDGDTWFDILGSCGDDRDDN
jgi:predicted ABC-type ATPase